MGGEPYNLSVAVVNMEVENSLGGKYLGHINNRSIIQKPYSNLSLALESVKRGKNWGAVYIGPHFSENIVDRIVQGADIANETIEGSRIKIYLDFTNQQISSEVHSELMKAFESFTKSMLLDLQMNPLLATPPLLLSDPVYGRKEPDFIEFTAPGMIMCITFLSAVGLSVLSIISEKKSGVLDRTRFAGVSTSEVIFSNLSVLFCIVVIQCTLVLVLTVLVFKLPSEGNILLVALSTLLVGIEGMAFGILISSVCDNENTAVMATLGSFFPNVILTGAIWSPEAMPIYLRYISYCLPLTVMINTVRSVLSRGWDISYVWDGYLVVIAWTLLLILIASFVFKYKR